MSPDTLDLIYAEVVRVRKDVEELKATRNQLIGMRRVLGWLVGPLYLAVLGAYVKLFILGG